MRRNLTSFQATILILSGLIPVSLFAQESTLHPSFQVLGSDAPYSFPEKMAVGPLGSMYILDTTLSKVFFLDFKTKKISLLCKPETVSDVSDIASDGKGNVWVLSGMNAKIYKLNRECKVQTEIISHHLPLRIQVNSFGEVVVLTGKGEALFDLYTSEGELLRSFGQRLSYGDETANAELSDGHIVPDSSGGFYFSFNYPPLIQHYGRTGRLTSEFKPESDVPIAPPNVSIRKQANAVAVNARYQILVLDMALDGRGRLYLLMSGKNKVPALNEGTTALTVVTDTGRTLKKTILEQNFHRIAVVDGRLYLLRNKEPLRLDVYPMP